MRNLVQPPPSRCPLCKGELRLRLVVEQSIEPSVMDTDIEVFVCANCGHEPAYVVTHDRYAAHTANKRPPAKTG
jgi:hypothetical protein